MKTIGIFTSTHGHESIALAIKEKIEHSYSDTYKVKLFADPLKFSQLYDLAYRLGPGVLGSPFQLSATIAQSDPKLKQAMKNLFAPNNTAEIEAFAKNNALDICINTYFSYNSALEKLNEKKLPFINVLADPKTVHPLLVADRADAQLAFDGYLVKKFKNKNLITSGWFVREKFEEKYDKQAIRKQLGLTNQFTVLVTSGSAGANAVLKILPSIINCQKPVTFIMACGKNDFLYHSIEGIKKTIQTISSSQANIVTLGFTKNLHVYMQAADLIVGKAGPNTLFESVACEVPFFAITHIHGQEDGNLELIKEYKLGFVEENDRKANQKLTQILNHPEKLTAFTKPLQRMKQYNQRSIETLMTEVRRLIGE